MKSVSKSAHRPFARTGFLIGILFTLVAVLAFTGSRVSVAETEARWSEIKTHLFGDRTVQDGEAVIGLQTPYRALDAAVVPVEINSHIEQTPEHFIQRLYLIIDENPSPIAAVFHFPGAHSWTDLSTRVRVNAYTHMRAVAETNDGELFMSTNFVKASGGCSAPSLKDPAAAAAQRGKMKLVLPEEISAGDALLAQLLIKHPNSSGLQFDQVSRQFIPADFVKTIKVSYQGETLFTVDADISISEDPSIRFNFVPDAPGSLDVEVTDSDGRTFQQSFDVDAVTKR